MPRRAKDRDNSIDFERIQKRIDDNPDDFFGPEETDRRMGEMMWRLGGGKPRMDYATGQNKQEPFLSEEELKRRGYPCKPWWDTKDQK